MNSDRFNRMKELMEEFRVGGIRMPKVGEADPKEAERKRLSKVIEFQDIIGRSTNKEITAAWDQLDMPQKNTFIWVISCTLSPDSVVSIMMETVGHDVKKKIREQFELDNMEIEKQFSEINQRKLEVGMRENELQKTIDAQLKIQKILNELRR